MTYSGFVAEDELGPFGVAGVWPAEERYNDARAGESKEYACTEYESRHFDGSVWDLL